MVLRATLLVVVLVLGSCAHVTSRNYPVDSIIDLRSGQRIDQAALIDRIIAHDYVVLGEKHDNPHHHRHQLWILRQLTARGWLQQLSLEMITPAQQRRFAPITPAQADDDAALQRALAWPEQGWPWQDYRELVRHAIQHAVPLQSANIDRAQVMALYQGTASTPAVTLSDQARATLLQDIEDSHCGHIQQPQTGKMLAIQLARDHAMAQSLLQTARGSVLIAGAFHARKDLGFPLHLQQLAPDKKLLALAFVETATALSNTETAELAQQYDVLWVTAAHQRGDPCAMFNATP